MRTITREQFQKLIIAQVLVLVVYIFLPFVTTSFLPLELQTYVNSTMESDLTVWQIIVVAFSIPLLIWAIHNYRGLYTFKPNAPKHLLYITIISGLYYVNVLEAYVFTNFESFFNDVLYILTGITLALVYFSNIADEFKKPAESDQNPN
jgi:hypothetical protein